MQEMKRKPAVYLLGILPVLLTGTMTLAISLTGVYARIKGIPESAIPRINGILITLPALLLWLPIALLLSNFVLFVVPPLRRIAEGYAAESNHPGFSESQRQLARIAVIMSMVCVPLILLGFIL
jgi:hypothetical protein